MTDTYNEDCKTCGHDRRDHIYEEGACRPGFVCEAGCTEYVRPSDLPYEPTPDEKRIVAWLRDEGTPHDSNQCDLCIAADAIERGEHRADAT